MKGENNGQCACAACGARFWRLSGFTRHRVGPWLNRACLTPEEMVERGFTQDSTLRWRGPQKGSGKRPPQWGEKPEVSQEGDST
jgi:hypothetical protein